MADQIHLPTVSVVIPVHTVERPIRQAVASVIGQSAPGTEVIVVCHNVSAGAIQGKLVGLDSTRYSLLELHDGIPSPAGPLNLGVESAQTDYVTVLGSDDIYEAHVFDSWRKELAKYPSEILVGQFKVDGVGRVLAPAPRVGRFRDLDAAKDLLYTRTPQLAVLFRSDLIQHSDFPGFTPGARNGEDIALSAFLWSVPSSISYSRCSDGFVVGRTANNRVTAVPLSVAELLSPVLFTLEQPWLSDAAPSHRTALALKLTTNHVLGILRGRMHSGPFLPDDLAHCREALLRIENLSPGYSGRLTRRDYSLVSAVLNDDAEGLERSLQDTHPLRKYLPLKLRYLLSSNGALRRAIRLILVPLSLRPATPAD